MIVVAWIRPPLRTWIVVWNRTTRQPCVREVDRVDLVPFVSACPACGLGPDAH